MRAGNEHDVAVRAGGRDPERVASALNDERPELDGVELVEARLLRLPRRVNRKGEAEDGSRAQLSGGAAGDAGAKRAPADDQRQVGKELRDDRDPGLVELVCGRRSPPAGDAIWLFDERDA